MSRYHTRRCLCASCEKIKKSSLSTISKKVSEKRKMAEELFSKKKPRLSSTIQDVKQEPFDVKVKQEVKQELMDEVKQETIDSGTTRPQTPLVVDTSTSWSTPPQPSSRPAFSSVSYTPASPTLPTTPTSRFSQAGQMHSFQAPSGSPTTHEPAPGPSTTQEPAPGPSTSWRGMRSISTQTNLVDETRPQCTCVRPRENFTQDMNNNFFAQALSTPNMRFTANNIQTMRYSYGLIK